VGRIGDERAPSSVMDAKNGQPNASLADSEITLKDDFSPSEVAKESEDQEVSPGESSYTISSLSVYSEFDVKTDV
jgi:hypothetical protein